MQIQDDYSKIMSDKRNVWRLSKAIIIAGVYYEADKVTVIWCIHSSIKRGTSYRHVLWGSFETYNSACKCLVVLFEDQHDTKYSLRGFPPKERLLVPIRHLMGDLTQEPR